MVYRLQIRATGLDAQTSASGRRLPSTSLIDRISAPILAAGSYNVGGAPLFEPLSTVRTDLEVRYGWRASSRHGPTFLRAFAAAQL
jgi:hypothetical protein